MKKIKTTLPYLILITLAFYILPFYIKDTGTAMLFLLIIIPIICFFNSFIYGIKNNFYIFYSLFVMVLFIPTIFIFYNKSASIYIFFYGIISLFGNFLGSIFKK